MSRKQRAVLFLFSLALVLGVAAVAQKSGSQSVEERAIRAADAQWSQAAAAKDLAKTLSFYADDAVILAPGVPVAAGREAIRAVWVGEFKDPAYALSWSTQAVEVSRSRDLAYSRGSYDATYTRAVSPFEQNRPVREHGKYLAVWKKAPGGAWRVTVDMYNPDAPATPIKR